MARNTTTSTAGTRLYYADLGTVLSPASRGTEIPDITKWGALPGNEEIEEYDTTRASQVKEDGSPDLIKQSADSYEDPGSLEITVAGEATIDAVKALKRTYKSLMIIFSSGSYALFDGWFKKTGSMLEENKEETCDVKIRAISELIYHKV